MAETGYDAEVRLLAPDLYYRLQDTTSTLLEEIAAVNGTWTGARTFYTPPSGYRGVPALTQLSSGKFGIVNYDAKMDPVTNKASFAVWVQTHGDGDFWHIVRSVNTHVDPFYAMPALGKRSGNWREWHPSVTTSWPGGFPTNTAVASTADTMYHVAAVYDDAATNSYVLYVNGSSVFTDNGISGNLVGAPGYPNTGKLGFNVIPALGAGFEHICDLAQFAWWRDKALSSTEVATLYAARDLGAVTVWNGSGNTLTNVNAAGVDIDPRSYKVVSMAASEIAALLLLPDVQVHTASTTLSRARAGKIDTASRFVSA